MKLLVLWFAPFEENLLKPKQNEARSGWRTFPVFLVNTIQLRSKWYPISFWLLRFCKGLVSILLFCLKKWDLHCNGARSLVGFAVQGARLRFQSQKLIVFLRFVVNPLSNRYKKCKIYRDTFFNYTSAADNNESSTKGIELIYMKEINPLGKLTWNRIGRRLRSSDLFLCCFHWPGRMSSPGISYRAC